MMDIHLRCGIKIVSEYEQKEEKILYEIFVATFHALLANAEVYETRSIATCFIWVKIWWLCTQLQ